MTFLEYLQEELKDLDIIAKEYDIDDYTETGYEIEYTTQE